MPELPDIELYIRALMPRIVDQQIQRLRLASPFLVRSIDPPAEAVIGRRITSLRRLGKRIVWAFEGDLFAVFHLMIAGRFRWKEAGAKIPGKVGLAAFDFDPEADLRIGPNGAWHWARPRPELEHFLAQYFVSRNEDE